MQMSLKPQHRIHYLHIKPLITNEIYKTFKIISNLAKYISLLRILFKTIFANSALHKY